MRLSDITSQEQPSGNKPMKLSDTKAGSDAPAPATMSDKIALAVGDAANTAIGDVSNAWDKLKADFVKTLPNEQYLHKDFWGKLKSDYQKTVATGMLPVDAFNLVMSPIYGAVHAGPVKALAAGEHALLSAAPGIDKKKLPTQENIEDQLMGDLSVIGPERGASLAAAASLPVPSVAELRTAAKAAYKIIDNSGMQIHPQAVSDLHSTITADLAKKGFHEKLMPKTDVAVSEIKAMANDKNPKSIQDIDTLRKIAGHAAMATEKADRTMARVVKDHIDDFMDNLQPHQTVGPKDQAAINALGVARDSWKKMSKAEIIDRAMEKAAINAHSKFSQSGMDNALRTEFRALARNDRAMARFSQDERDAIKQVAVGGPIANAFRLFGKLAPHGIVSAGFGAGAGYAVGGPIGAMALPVAGEVSRAAATAITERNARLASEVMRRGSKAPTSAATTAQRIYPGIAAANVVRPKSSEDVADQLGLQ